MRKIHYTTNMLPSNWFHRFITTGIIFTIFTVITNTSIVHAMGEPPDWEKIETKKQVEKKVEVKKVVKKPVVKKQVVKKLNYEAIELARKTYERMLKQKQFERALTSLQKIPEPQRKKNELKNYRLLTTFKKIDEQSKDQSNIFNEDDELNSQNKAIVTKLYREAKNALLINDRELAKNLLIHIIYIHRRNYKAKKLLQMELDQNIGDYKIENIEDKYWVKSETHFYGGNYEKAIHSLKTLTYFDKENAEIYERLGSSYYMSGQKERAIEAWTTAIYLNPKNKDLQKLIDKTKELVKRDQVIAKKRREKREKRKEETKNKKTDNKNLQLLGVYSNQSQAYNYAQKLKKQGLQGIVEELENGKWAVKVPKK